MARKLRALAEHDVEIALSTVRERLLDVHASQALELIEHVRDQVPTWRALGIYCHLHRVEGHKAVELQTRVLARLGRQPEGGGPPRSGDVAGALEWDSPWAWLRRLRRRLRGRRNLELRLWVELHAGRTEARLLDVHVTGALRLIELLEPARSYAEVVQLYTERMRVPASLSRAVYFLALSRIGGAPVAPSIPTLIDPGKPSEPRDGQPLRIATR